MRAARSLTVSCTLHHMYAQARQERAELAPLTMAVSFLFLRAMMSHTSVLYGTIDPAAGTKSCSAFPITRSTVSEFLRCDIRAPLHDCCSACVMLDPRVM